MYLRKILYFLSIFLFITSFDGQAVQIIDTEAGTGLTGYNGDNIPAITATLFNPNNVCCDLTGNIYIADSNNNRIRKVDPITGMITTVAGVGIAGFNGNGIPATLARLNSPSSITVDSIGQLYISDTGNNQIRKVDLNGIITTVAGIDVNGFSGNGGPATTAQLSKPTYVAFDSAGNMYIADSLNNCVRRVDAVTGIIDAFAGIGESPGFSGDGGLATAAQLNNPNGLAFDDLGNLYISDNLNFRIRKVDTNNMITTFAGNGTSLFVNGVQALSSGLGSPSSIAFNSLGQMYITNVENDQVVRINTDGIITAFAGTGTAGFSGDNGPPLLAQFDQPTGITVDTNDKIYIVDRLNQRVRSIVATPVINSISPSSGTIAGGTNVILTGIDFLGISQVFFGSNLAVFTVNSETSITATLPAGVVGNVEVTIASPNTVSNSIPFTYVANPAPTITSLNPNAGTINGEISVKITGENLTNTNAVTFGSNNAISFTVVSDTVITAISPAGTPGTVQVNVTTPSGISNSFPFIYFPNPVQPSITSIDPNFGPTSGGTLVSITGSNLTTTQKVYFGNNSSTDITVISDSLITVTSPAGIAGTVNVNLAIVNSGGQLSNSLPFTYIANSVQPVLTSIDPNFGPTSGGTIVNITGSNFTNVTAVNFGSNHAMNFVVLSDNLMTAVSPAGNVGVVNVTVSTLDETSNAALFTYTNPINSVVFPPNQLRGSHKQNRFATQTDNINILKWSAPSQGNPPRLYRIYRDSQLNHLIGEVSSTKRLRFEDHKRKKHMSYTYYVVSVDSFGHVSIPATVTIKGK